MTKRQLREGLGLTALNLFFIALCFLTLIPILYALSVSFNGKTRFTLDFAADATKEQIQEAALGSEQAQKYLEGKQVVKVIVVPGRIVNIVIK